MLSVNNVFIPEFDEAIHRYAYKGYALPSVTQILRPLSEAAYRGIPERILRQAADLGTAVHACIEYKIQDDLDDESVLTEWSPYLQAFDAWASAFNPEFLATEQKLACDEFAGTIDCICRIDGQTYVIDFKTTNKLMPMVAVQTAAYELLARCSGKFGDQMMRRAALQLKDDGTFTWETYSDIEDYETFEHLLRVQQWVEKNV